MEREVYQFEVTPVRWIGQSQDDIPTAFQALTDYLESERIQSADVLSIDLMDGETDWCLQVTHR